MKRQNKIFLASLFTVLAAFATLLCLFAIDGISLTTVFALAAAYGFAHLTGCFFKVENILRKQQAAKARKVNQARQSLTVVRRTGTTAA